MPYELISLPESAANGISSPTALHSARSLLLLVEVFFSHLLGSTCMMLPRIKLQAPLDVITASPLIRGLVLALQFATIHDGIGLTAKGTFNRKFVRWAAHQFQWPGLAIESPLDETKLLGESDFLPLAPLRALAIRLKFLRRAKSTLVANDRGLSFLENPAASFHRIASEYLFGFFAEPRKDHPQLNPLKLWVPILEYIESEGDEGISPLGLVRKLYPELAAASDLELTLKTWDLRSTLKFLYLRRLCWLGLLYEDRSGRTPLEEGTYHKTPLWTACMHWNADSPKELVLH